MARIGRIAQSERIFFVTTNLLRGLGRFNSLELGIICQALDEARARRKFRLPGFVIMPNHLHLLVLPETDDTLSGLVQEIKFVSSRKINARRKRRGALWQKDFFDRYMRTPKEVLETLEYIHANPVRKELTAKPEDWQWSSASAFAESDSIIPIDVLELPAETEKRFR